MTLKRVPIKVSAADREIDLLTGRTRRITYEIVDDRQGFFHKFLQEGDEGGIGVVAVVEFEDGTVDTVSANMVRFCTEK